MKLIAGSTLFLLLAFLAGCATYRDFHFTYDERVDFSTYETFAWVTDSDSLKADGHSADVPRNNAKNFVNHCMTERNYRVDPEEPDLLLRLVLLNEKKEEVTSYSSLLPKYYYYDSYYYPYYYRYPSNYTYYGLGGLAPSFGWGVYPADLQEAVTTYVRGTIMLFLIDRAAERVVWVGSAEGDIYDPTHVQTDVHPAIHKIIENLPKRKTSEE